MPRLNGHRVGVGVHSGCGCLIHNYFGDMPNCTWYQTWVLESDTGVGLSDLPKKCRGLNVSTPVLMSICDFVLVFLTL
jgi:hypothetical protein